jgi:hypothetical protein
LVVDFIQGYWAKIQNMESSPFSGILIKFYPN